MDVWWNILKLCWTYKTFSVPVLWLKNVRCTPTPYWGNQLFNSHFFKGPLEGSTASSENLGVIIFQNFLGNKKLIPFTLASLVSNTMRGMYSRCCIGMLGKATTEGAAQVQRRVRSIRPQDWKESRSFTGVVGSCLKRIGCWRLGGRRGGRGTGGEVVEEVLHQNKGINQERRKHRNRKHDSKQRRSGGNSQGDAASGRQDALCPRPRAGLVQIRAGGQKAPRGGSQEKGKGCTNGHDG